MPRKKKPVEIRTNRLVLEDLAGNPRATLAAEENGAVALDLYGGGAASLSLAIDSGGNPKITFVNKNGSPVLGIGVSDDFGQGFSISDAEGRPVCFVFAAPDGVPRIQLFQAAADAEAIPLWSSPEPARKAARRKRK